MSERPVHRSVSSIRPSPNPTAPAGPHTPTTRTISSSFGSPSTLRADEDCVIVEIGSRYIRVGFAGDATPKAVLDYGPEEQRRAGDYRRWTADYEKSWRTRQRSKEYGEEQELWKPDLRGIDLGLIGDKIDRAIRESFVKYLLIDSRPRRMALALPSALPLPLLSTILDTLFHSFQPPTISLMSTPVLTTTAAGLRSALVVDIGWSETTVTAIYEFREVQCRRSIRATKVLGTEMMKLLVDTIYPENAKPVDPNDKQKLEAQARMYRNTISFEECEDVVMRLAHCKSTLGAVASGLQSININEGEGSITDSITAIPLRSKRPPTTLHLPFSSLAKPCEQTFFAADNDYRLLDDEETPLHLLVYKTLLSLPYDVRSLCMSRIIFTGGGSKIPGIKSRTLEEVDQLIAKRGWDPVVGKAAAKLKARKLQQAENRQAYSELNDDFEDEEEDMVGAAHEGHEADPVDEQVQREARKTQRETIHGTLRGVESLGAWSGASLVSQLKIGAVSTVEREQWLQSGAAGASKIGEVNTVSNRQSMSSNALRSAAAGEKTSWTLGVWA